nr:MAG TPA: hypothetical protein [Caudoviricetes sp.]
MHVADIKFDFILFIRHLLYLHLIKHLIQIFRFDPYFAFFIKNAMPVKHGFCLLFQFYIFYIRVDLYVQTVCLKIDFPVCREIVASRIQEYCKRRIRGFPFRKMMIGIWKSDFFHHCHDFFMRHERNPLSIFCTSSLFPFSSAGAICSLPATLPPLRFAWPCSRRWAIWYLSLEWTVMVRELLLSAVFLTAQLFLYLPVRFGAFACISFFTVLDTSFTASLTVSVARSAYSFSPSMIASARPSTVVLLSDISSPLCQGSPDLQCLILILHVVNKCNIINIPTEQDTEMLRVNSGHLTAVTDDKIKFRFRIDLFCFPVLLPGKIIHVGITFIVVAPYKDMVSCPILLRAAFLYRDPFTHEFYHQNISLLIPKNRYFNVSVMVL